MSRKNVSILGSTGSIGVNTLDVIDRNRDEFRVVALTANRNFEKLAGQCARFDAALAVIADPGLEQDLVAALERHGAKAEVRSGEAGLAEAAGMDGTDIVMAAIVGAAGLGSAFEAARRGKKILLANKESLVIAGEVFIREARKNGARILPVDSEHNAIFQALPDGFEDGLDAAGVEKIILTASGGPFRTLPADQFADITPAQACNHPNWSMGRKISVDSATLMNKGLEVIEARWLFGMGPERIRVVVHPQSVVHSMVEFVDGSFKAQLGVTDMRHPIQYALSWPERWPTELPPFDPVAAGPLEFEEPDLERFPCLGLAWRALRAGGAAPAVLNAANEVAVEAFLQGRLRFTGIPAIIADTLERHAGEPVGSLDELRRADARARECAARLLGVDS